MKNTTPTLIAATGPESNPASDLQWVEEVAALLPEESRLGWYRNVQPWLRMLPPDDEIAHLAYSMGYLALLTRSTPALMAAERVKAATMLQRLTEEIAASVKTTADYHQKLGARLTRLPEEIAQGLHPDALAEQIVAEVRERFLHSGLPEAGRLLTEECDRLRRLIAGHTHTMSEFRLELNEARDHAKCALDSVVSGADAVKKSIDHWDREARQVQWIDLGLALLIGWFLGTLMCWWALAPAAASPPPRPPTAHQSKSTTPPAAGRITRHERK